MSSIQSVISNAIIANLINSSQELNASVLNLASGIRYNASVADFSVGTLLKSSASTLGIANINAGQGKSLLQTAQGGLDQILELLQEQKDLAVQAQDDSLTDNELAVLNSSFQSLTTEINRIATTTKFNNKTLLDGTISGTTTLSTTTGQATENYTLLSTSDYSFSGTVAAGELATASTFAIKTSTSTGKTAGSATLTFATAGVTGDATITIGGQALTFGDGAADATELATAFVTAAEISTNNTIRSFIYTDNGDGTVTVTSADLGTDMNATNFNLTNDSGGDVTAATFGSDSIIGADKNFGNAGNTLGTNRAPTSDTLDAGLEGQFSNFTATLDTSGTQNSVVFTVDLNGQTYTSQAVTLFGGSGSGFNGKGNTIKNGQFITFYNADGPTDDNGEYTDNGFTLKIGASDITIAGGTQDAFETDLTNTASGFLDQLEDNRLNQSRSIILSETNPSGGDFTISTVEVGSTFYGIEGFDAIGTNAKGDINFVGDGFGDSGNIGSIGEFSFNAATNTITVTIGDEVYSADISDNTANTGGIVDGAGEYNSTTKTLTAGAGTVIVFHSASTDDGRQLRIDLSNITDTSIDLSSSTGQARFTDDLNALFGVDDNRALSFQVGDTSSNTIGVSIGSAKTTDIYLDDAGTSKTLDISATGDAAAAEDILDNAINTVIALSATANAGITSFTSAITNNNVSIQNYSAASSLLLNTDYALESSLYAQAALKVNSGIAVLAQEQSRLQNLLKLLSF
ncbi:MAG: fliC [Rickettsiaceae bacterium]|jgi:flagellin|nr:fliC [Rickettsiaceae bacterium]